MIYPVKITLNGPSSVKIRKKSLNWVGMFDKSRFSLAVCMVFLMAALPFNDALAQSAVEANSSMTPVEGKDGYQLWLDYSSITSDDLRQQYRQQFSRWEVPSRSATAEIIKQELAAGLSGLLGEGRPSQNAGMLLVATPAQSEQVKAMSFTHELASLGEEGFLIKTVPTSSTQLTVVTANTDLGLLYGTFELLRLLQTQEATSPLNIRSVPSVALRVLNHWDNLDRYVERGYAGESIWNWHKLPEYKNRRYYDYARANASIGINGTVLNNVNSDPLILTPQYLEKVQALADIFRPYGIKVYLSVKFSSPNLIGGLPTSDPLDKDVQAWWEAKAKEIYTLIPDFGGFLVKANSEGQPGPGDYGRSHAQGANMLAKALAPHGGNVMWRAFVYESDAQTERSTQAYKEFKPLDGEFEANVLVQVKNGPIDFQPREPISPLFGATPRTPLMMEFQITQEYLGFSTHLVYLGTLYEEVLQADTFAEGEGSSVAKVVDGSLFDYAVTGMAGVANIGSDRNWTGHIFGQANWYVFGRMAWNPNIRAQEVAQDWVRRTFTHQPQAIRSIVSIMMGSREAAVNYMTPLGLHHIMGWGHHYGPGPWVGEENHDWMRDDWKSTYYHSATSEGLGKDRTRTGSNAVAQYFPELAKRYAHPNTTPTELLLWFHHLPWDYPLPSGNTLWNELVTRYYIGAATVDSMVEQWAALSGQIDPELHRQVSMSLAIQQKEAAFWRDACVLYFQTFSQRPIPKPFKAPVKPLSYYKGLSFPRAPGDGR